MARALSATRSGIKGKFVRRDERRRIPGTVTAARPRISPRENLLAAHREFRVIPPKKNNQENAAGSARARRRRPRGMVVSRDGKSRVRACFANVGPVRGISITIP